MSNRTTLSMIFVGLSLAAAGCQGPPPKPPQPGEDWRPVNRTAPAVQQPAHVPAKPAAAAQPQSKERR
jgi:hypothetical protein